MFFCKQLVFIWLTFLSDGIVIVQWCNLIVHWKEKQEVPFHHSIFYYRFAIEFVSNGFNKNLFMSTLVVAFYSL